MLVVLRNSWPLLLGMLLLLIGNGIQGTLLGIRGHIEGYGSTTMSLVMSAYSVGFLVGCYRAPRMIQRVGHVRVFAALASLISAALILYAEEPLAWAWVGLRFLVGVCFAGVYVVAESWLNNAATNETRGQTLSMYMIVQVLGVIVGQGILNLADPAAYTLFVIASVLVSISFAPILLVRVDTPAFQTTKRMTLVQLFRISPLGCVGTFLLGGVFAAIFGMSSVFGTARGLSVSQISAFVATMYIGGLVCQFPIGWLSDRMDRRWLILGLTLGGAVITLVAGLVSGTFGAVLAVGFVIGGVANPLYALLIAYTNDFLEAADMAAASAGLLFIYALGAMSGPLVIGALMDAFGANAYFVYVAVLFAAIAGYAGYRMTRRAAPEATAPYAPVLPSASPVALEAAQEVAIERAAEGR
jgi:MFS family permease